MLREKCSAQSLSYAGRLNLLRCLHNEQPLVDRPERGPRGHCLIEKIRYLSLIVYEVFLKLGTYLSERFDRRNRALLCF